MPERQTEFTPSGGPQFAQLEQRRRQEFPYKSDDDPYLNQRLRRSLSWLDRAERELYHSDPSDYDMAFTCYWFAFNSLYAKDPHGRPRLGERDSFRAFFETIIGSENERKHIIFNEIWGNFSEPIRALLDNEFVFEPFWRHHNGVSLSENWEITFEKDKAEVNQALGTQDIYEILSVLFNRLYAVRNQIIHGNATWNGGRNRDQLWDGTRIMASLVPRFITLVMDNPTMDMGRPYYTLPSEAAKQLPVTYPRQ